MAIIQKILIVSDAGEPQTNGVVRTYQALEQELMARKKKVKVISPEKFRFTISMPGYSEIKLVLFPYAKVKKYINDFDPDCIHIATEGPLGWAVRRYCIKNNLSFTTCYHTKFPDYIATRVPRFMRTLIHSISVNIIKNFHAPSATIMTASKSIENELRSYGLTNKILRLTRGTDRNVFHLGDKNKFKNLLQPVALYVGRVAIEKNLSDFLKMPWHGSKVIVGDGPQRDRLMRQFPNAVFLGKRKGAELADLYRSADVFVFPSKTDTFGLVMIEAMACGLPIAAYPVMGPKDIVVNRVLGVLDEDLSCAAQEALKHGSAAQRHQYAIQTYGWDKACTQFLSAF